MYLIAGLGNPGKEYQRSRHNLGFIAIEQLAKKLGVLEFKLKRKCQSLAAETRIKDHKIILAEPQTFMNLSGEAVHLLASWHKIPSEKIIIIHDELDLEPGKLQIKFGGGTAGHRGLDSIVEKIKTKDFIRVRIGIGKPGSKDPSAYVLSLISKQEQEPLYDAANQAADAIINIVENGLQNAMNKFNA